MKIANVKFVIGTASEIDDMLGAIEFKLHWEHFLRLKNNLKPECAKLCKEAPIGFAYVEETGNILITESVMVDAFIDNKDTRKELATQYETIIFEDLMKQLRKEIND